MKQLITLLAAIWIINANGQTYHKLLENEKVWTVQTIDYVAVIPIVNNYVYSYSKDTVINSKVYQDFKNDAFLREDTIERKVYRFGNWIDECILYDFNAKKGDSINICDIIIKIDSVSTIKISTGETRNIFYYSGGVSPSYYIEGIGSNKGLVTLSEPIGPPSINLICVKKGETDVYGSGCEGLSIHHLVTHKEIKVYPIPASNYINVDCYEAAASYRIFDLLGRTKQLDKLRDTRIELTNFKSGFYIIEFYSNNNKIIGRQNLIIKNQ